MSNDTLVPASINIGTCAPIGFYAENIKRNSVTIGTRVLITAVTTVQNITQLYTMIPKYLLNLRDVYIIQFYLTLYVEKQVDISSMLMITADLQR